jgi:hypothetical protein
MQAACNGRGYLSVALLHARLAPMAEHLRIMLGN